MTQSSYKFCLELPGNVLPISLPRATTSISFRNVNVLLAVRSSSCPVFIRHRRFSIVTLTQESLLVSAWSCLTVGMLPLESCRSGGGVRYNGYPFSDTTGRLVDCVYDPSVDVDGVLTS